MPGMGIVDSYGGKTVEYYNAFGLYLGGESITQALTEGELFANTLKVWSVFNMCFFVASLST